MGTYYKEKNFLIFHQQKSSSPRWNNSDGKTKELKSTTDLADDEKNPDVIPHGKNSDKSAISCSVRYGKSWQICDDFNLDTRSN